jgi:hypothetical protein
VWLLSPTDTTRILDNLPAAVRMYDQKNPNEIHYERGFPLGVNGQDGSKYILNHIQFVVKYHEAPDYEGARIVGFEVCVC